MKRIVSLICAVFMVLSAITVSADVKLIYGGREINPVLNFPMDKKYIMEGGSLVLEGEDFVLDSDMMVADDDTASGGRYIKPVSTAWVKTLEEVGATPSYMSEIQCDAGGVYTLWFRNKGASQFSCWISTDGIKYTEYYSPSGTFDGNVFRWSKTAEIELKEGKNLIAINYRIPQQVDKIIITRDSKFVPVGIDDVPDYVEPGASLWPLPTITPPSGHPRVYFTKNDIERLNEHFKLPQLKKMVDSFESTADEVLNCKLPATKPNYDDSIMAKIGIRALMYALGRRDRSHAKQTFNYIKEYFDSVSYEGGDGGTWDERSRGANINTAGRVYDWCYDALNDKERKYLIDKTIEFAKLHPMRYPPVGKISFSGHGVEGGLLADYLAAGIAFYDEYPEFYNLTAGRLMAEYVEPIKVYTKSGSYANGNAYGMARYDSAVASWYLFRAMGAEDVFGENFTSYAYKLIYEKLPGGAWFKDSDDFIMKGRKASEYELEDLMTMLAAATDENPYALSQLKLIDYVNGYYGNVASFLFHSEMENEKIESKPIDDLPLSYHTGYPFSSIVARTGWQGGADAPVAVAKLQMYDINISDHNFLNHGSFQFWYKGMLALQGGVYEASKSTWGKPAHWNYNTRTIASNSLLVHDPDEVWHFDWGFPNDEDNVNDGGQRSHFDPEPTKWEQIVGENNDGDTGDRQGGHFATEKGWYIGPNKVTPEFSYISSNLAHAYTKKVEKYDRSMVFMDFFDEQYPAALVVFDRVKSSNKDFKKTWLLHSQSEPVVEGKVTTITREEEQMGYGGKLVNTTLLPVSSKIEKVGGPGKEFWVEGENRDVGTVGEGVVNDAGAWRIELSPTSAKTDDVFLNVMYVTDSDKDYPKLSVQNVSGNNYYGAMIRDRLVTFGKEYDKINNEVIVAIPDTQEFTTVSCLLNDMESGIWEISGTDGTVIYAEVKKGEAGTPTTDSKEGYSLYFRGKPGVEYTVRPDTKGNAADEIDYPEVVKAKTGDFYIYDSSKKNFVYQSKPTKLINGVPYASAAMMAELRDANVTDNGTSVIISKSQTVTYLADTTDYILNGAPAKLIYPTKMIDGVLYVSIEDMEISCDYEFAYDDYAKVARITPVIRNIAEASERIPGLPINATLVIPAYVTCSKDDGNIAENTLDLNLGSRWSASGDNEYLIFDFGKITDFNKLMMGFYSGHTRSTTFDIYISNDNISFSHVLSGTSSGTTENPEMYEIGAQSARYVKIIYHGNSVNKWNSVNEVIFLK